MVGGGIPAPAGRHAPPLRLAKVPHGGVNGPSRRLAARLGRRMARRLVRAMMMHETSTFSPLATPMTSFGRAGAFSGEAVIREIAGTNTPLGGFIDLAQETGAEFTVPMAASAHPSGLVT